jgi:hypothetical protein
LRFRLNVYELRRRVFGFFFFNAELTPEQKAALVLSLKVSCFSLPLFPYRFCSFYYFVLNFARCDADFTMAVCLNLLALVQNKLEGLVAQHTDVLENLAPKVRKRVDVLREIQVIRSESMMLYSVSCESTATS